MFTQAEGLKMANRLLLADKTIKWLEHETLGKEVSSSLFRLVTFIIRKA